MSDWRSLVSEDAKQRERMRARTLAFDDRVGKWHWQCRHGCPEVVHGPYVDTFEECEAGWDQHKLDCHLPSNGQLLRSMGVKIGNQKKSRKRL